ncbi:MAG: ABC transporter permease [Verrucomicrobia bacterium]|nr:ABC transporter permease [Verrucomicrobiota bacterium]MCH8528127.1 ABC transporter permease [Kiritimatiellia bacterium]
MKADPVRRERLVEVFLTAPGFVWLLLFFLLPTFNVLLISFRPSTLTGGIGEGWTLDTLQQLRNPDYPGILFRTLWVSLAITVSCLLLSVPVAYFLARCSQRWKTRLLLLIMIPFLTNFIIRVFAWKVILHPEGWLASVLAFAGLIPPGTQLLYNVRAVILVSVYTYLPFALLPVYAVAEKFDFALMEAAMDLGCNRIQAFFRVFVPGISRGLWTATLLVLIPNLGAYVVPDIVGGHSSSMLGNVIVRRLFSDRNLPHAAGLSSVLTVLVLLPMIVVILHRRRREAH